MNDKLKVLDLFSGIGGFSLGLGNTGGFETVAFCEIEPYPRAVLAKHWPGVTCYEDVREINRSGFWKRGFVEVICGGFPCQDISFAGKGAGLAGERSGLWSEFHRLIKELKPRYAIIENVAALRSRGLDEVLRSLTAIGYDAEWHCIPASAVGAPHRRDRVWIIGYPHDSGKSDGTIHDETSRVQVVAADSYGIPPRRLAISWGECSQWLVEPDVGRVANGVPRRMDRIRALGNSIVPQIAEIIGNAILANEKAQTHKDA